VSTEQRLIFCETCCWHCLKTQHGSSVF